MSMKCRFAEANGCAKDYMEPIMNLEKIARFSIMLETARTPRDAQRCRRALRRLGAI